VQQRYVDDSEGTELLSWPRDQGGLGGGQAVNIPGYKIQRLIGRGGMAAVFLATQESLDRPVALKVLHPDFAQTPEFSARFLNEGRIIAALNHANIITIHDIGIAGDNHYISMEYVEGGDLKEWIAQGIDADTAFQLLKTIGGCLGFAHELGIVHRDVKPGNILFRKDGTPLLTDFGIAKQLANSQDRTLTGTVMGSPHYLSPEQGQGVPVDGRSDIYSLGIIFYEMLTGKKPFRGDSDVSTIFQHLQQPIPQLPSAVARFQPLLDRMLAKDPDERFDDTPAMLHFIRDMGNIKGRGNASPARAHRHAARMAWLGAMAYGLTAAVVAYMLTARVWLPDGQAPAGPASSLANAGQSGAGDVRGRVAAAPEAPGTSSSARATKTAGVRKSEPARSNDAVKKGASARRASSVALDQGDGRGKRKYTRSQKNKVSGLLRLAEKALREYRLTTPASNSAYHYYRQVLKLDPGNRQAQDGLHEIAERYAWLAEEQIGKSKHDRAQHYIALGLKVQPRHSRLLQLKKDADADAGNGPRQLWEGLKGFFTSG